MLFWWLLLQLIAIGSSSKILFFIGALTSYSHRTSIQPLANSLAQRGHSVHFLTPLATPPNQHPSIQNFCPPELLEFHQNFTGALGVSALRGRVAKKLTNEPLKELTNYFDTSHKMCQLIFESGTFEPWLRKEGNFDLVIIDNSLNTCAFGLAKYLKAKTIIYSSVGLVPMWDFFVFGLPLEESWYPGWTSSMPGGRLTFLDRVLNVLSITSLSWAYESYHLPQIEQLLHESLLGEGLKGMPKLKEVIQNTSLLLINQHYSDQYPKSYPPFLVPVGGMHLQDSNKTLPEDIQNFIGEDQFIFISFGSLIQISAMPNKLFKIFLNVLEHSKLKFLFKWDGKIPEGRGKNILFRQWFPQNLILAHPQIVGFITQGGQVSLQEGIFNGVPLIIAPVLGDQDLNAKRMDLTENAVVIELATLTSDILEGAIYKILNDDRYKINAMKLSRASRHRPMSSLQTAIWWVESVIQSDDLSIVKPLSMTHPMWQQLSLDLWFFVFILILLIILLTFLLLKFICVKLFSINNKIKIKSS